MAVARNALIYMGGSLVGQAAGLLVIPIIAQFLAPADYGAAALFSTCVAFLGPAVGMSMGTHVARNFFRVTPSEMARINSNALWAIGLNSMVVLALVLATAPWIAALAGIPPGWVCMACMVAAGNAIAFQYQALQRVRGQAVGYATFACLTALLAMALSLLLVAVLHLGWRGRSAGHTVAACVAASFGGVLMWRQGSAGLPAEKQVLRRLYRISLPLVPHSLAAQVTLLNSRFFLDRLIGKDAVGLYAMANSFGSLLSMPVDAFNNAWTPWVYRQLAMGDEGARLRVVRAIYVAALAILFLALCLGLILPGGIRLLLPSSYQPATALVGWILSAFALQGWFGLLLPLLVDKGKTDALATITIFAAMVSVALNYFFIRALGTVGAAMAANAGAGVRCALIFLYARKATPMPWLKAMRFRKPNIGLGHSD